MTFDMRGLPAFRNAVAKAAPAALAREVRRAVTNTLQDFERALIVDRMRSGDPNTVRSRSNTLAKSFHRPDVVGETLATIKGTAVMGGANAPYARLQEFGGVVTPQNSAWLTIAVGAGLTAGGKRRFASLRDYAPNEIYFVPHGNGFLAFQRVGRNSRLVAVLKKQVTLQPKLGFRDTFRKVTDRVLPVELEKAGARALASVVR